MLSQRDQMSKAMNGAYKSAMKGGTLGKGFGGEPPSKPIASKYSSKGMKTKLANAADKMFNSRASS